MADSEARSGIDLTYDEWCDRCDYGVKTGESKHGDNALEEMRRLIYAEWDVTYVGDTPDGYGSYQFTNADGERHTVSGYNMAPMLQLMADERLDALEGKPVNGISDRVPGRELTAEQAEKAGLDPETAQRTERAIQEQLGVAGGGSSILQIIAAATGKAFEDLGLKGVSAGAAKESEMGVLGETVGETAGKVANFATASTMLDGYDEGILAGTAATIEAADKGPSSDAPEHILMAY